MLLDKVKAAVRVKTTAFDGEIQGLIDACMKDLKIAGVGCLNQSPAEGQEPSAGDPLLERAAILYAKANFGYGEDENCERFRKAYEALKCSLVLSSDYAEKEGGLTVCAGMMKLR